MKRLLLLLWLVSAPLLLAGQDYQAPEVKVSTEQVRIAEKLYYVHKVLPKQTVFSICKAYGITEEELKAANPGLENGLKADALLYIPASKEAAGTEVRTDDNKPGQTLSDNEEPGPGETSNAPTAVIEHKVRLFESARSIARKYGITADELLDYNGIRARDVYSGRILLIPIRGKVDNEEDDSRTELNPDSGTEVHPEEVGPDDPEEPMPPVRRVRWFSSSDPLRIALVLPFNLSSTASASFLNFYSGALLALQNQKEQGAHVVLNVFDLAQGAEQILSDSKFEGCDLIVGPAEASTMEPFLQFSDERGVAFVSPLDHKADSLAGLHPCFYQVPPALWVQAENMVEDLHVGPHQHVILVPGPTTDSLLLGHVEAALQRSDITYHRCATSQLPEYVKMYGSAVNPAKVLIGTENKAVATEAIRQLNALAKKNVPLETYCTNRVRNYETSDPDALFNINTHVSAPYYVDYSDPKDQAFVLQYRALFSAEPDDFAFQGYDVLSYFIAAMTRLGTGFLDNADTAPMQLLHCNFQFRRDDEKSGWRNRATRPLFYDRETFTIAVTK